MGRIEQIVSERIKPSDVINQPMYDHVNIFFLNAETSMRKTLIREGTCVPCGSRACPKILRHILEL